MSDPRMKILVNRCCVEDSLEVKKCSLFDIDRIFCSLIKYVACLFNCSVTVFFAVLRFIVKCYCAILQNRLKRW